MEVLAQCVGEPGCFAEAGFEGKMAAAAGGLVEGVADGAGDVNRVAGFGGGAEDRAAGRVGGAEDGDGEGERRIRGWEGGDVAADERAAKVAGPAGDGVEELVGGVLRKVAGESGGGEGGGGGAGHGGDVGDGAGDGFAGDEVQGGALNEVAAFDELVDFEEELVALGSDHGAVIAGADEDVGIGGAQVGGAVADAGEEVEFAHGKGTGSHEVTESGVTKWGCWALSVACHS